MLYFVSFVSPNMRGDGIHFSHTSGVRIETGTHSEGQLIQN